MNAGNYGVKWNPLQGWQDDAAEPGLSYTTVLEGEAKFNGAANFGMAPSLTAHLDSFFKLEVGFSTMLHSTVVGDTANKQVVACWK